MNGTTYDCIVIGGGISGISFAHYMHTINKRVLIIEKDRNTGGRIQSLFSEQYPHYWREFGAHTCYNSYTRLLSIVKEIKRTDLIRPLGKGSYMTYSDGQIKKMFAEMSIPSLILNGPKIFFVSKNGKTVKEHFSRIVGASNYNRLFSSLFRAVISQNADDYPAELFLKRRNNRYKEFPRKYTFKKGLSSFLDSIVENDNLQIEKSSEVTDIQHNRNGYRITAEGKTFNASNIAIATDPQTASRLVKEMEAPLSALLASAPLFRSESLNVIVPKDKPATGNVAGIISVSGDFLSAVSRDLVEDEKLRSFTFHFENGKKDEGGKFDVVCKVLGISPSDILEWKTARHTLPSLRMPHLDMAGQVETVKKSNDVYILGNYFYGLSMEDCVNRSFHEFERFRQRDMRK
ncbi:MAG: FAD-dependent oxidoreductase [Prevotella sp.]|nr:FAD-dependent oxidoreductase [Prevotella sp.]